jgi:hypothetical protein
MGRYLGMVVGASARYGPRNPDPLRHIWTPRRASLTGVNYRALCGASIRPRPWVPPDERDTDRTIVAWDSDHPRACRACVNAEAARTAEIARRHA